MINGIREKAIQEVVFTKLKEKTFLEILEETFNQLKNDNYFNATQHKILAKDIQEIWTSFLLFDVPDITSRIIQIGHDLSRDDLNKIYQNFHSDGDIEFYLKSINKSPMLLIDPQDPSQEAVESFLRDINNNYESKFTLDDFNTYARNKVFIDTNQEQIERRKIEFKKLYETAIINECIIPKTISLEALEADLKTEAILEGFLNKDAPTLISASGGVGKSALVLNMMLALGSPDVTHWLGFKKAKSRYTSMIVQQEDSINTITNRLKLMCADPTMKSGIQSIHFIGNEGFKVTGKTLHDDSLIDYITQNINQMFINGENIPDILVLDSLSVFAGSSENDAMSMRSVMNKLFSMCAKYSITPVVIHHQGKDLKYRGSTAIVDSVRCHYTLRSVGGEKAEKTLKDIGIGDTVHLNKIERPKANDLYGKFSLTYICNNMIFRTINQAMEVAGKTPEQKINDKLQEIRDIVEDEVFGSEEFTNLIMKKFESSTSTAKRGIKAAVEGKYILTNTIGRKRYYFTNEDDFEEFKDKQKESN